MILTEIRSTMLEIRKSLGYSFDDPPDGLLVWYHFTKKRYTAVII